MLKFLNFFVSIKSTRIFHKLEVKIPTTIAYSNNLSAILLVIRYEIGIFLQDLN